MRAPSLLMLCAVSLAASPLRAQSLDARLLSGLVWRNVGPFRGGRISAVSGVIGQPGVFYFGAANGGVWKTTSAGETWYPIFDSITTTSSIGAVEVAPSDANGDQAPTRATLALARASCDELRKVVERWKHVVQVDLPKFNRVLSSHGRAALAAPSAGE